MQDVKSVIALDLGIDLKALADKVESSINSDMGPEHAELTTRMGLDPVVVKKAAAIVASIMKHNDLADIHPAIIYTTLMLFTEELGDEIRKGVMRSMV